jgi:hypothetical protein
MAKFKEILNILTNDVKGDKTLFIQHINKIFHNITY